MAADPNGIAQAVFDAPNAQIKTTVVAGTPSVSGVKFDLASVLGKVYDPSTGTLRVISVA